MKITDKLKNKISKKIKKAIFMAIKPFLPFILLILVIVLLVSYLLDSVFVNTTQADSSTLSESELQLRNMCIEKAEYLNTCNNFVNDEPTNRLLDVNHIERDKQIEWSHLYTIMTLQNLYNGREMNSDLLYEIGEYFKCTFKYERNTIKTEEKVTEKKKESWKVIHEEIQYILIESTSIYGSYQYSYKENIKLSDDGTTKITKKEYVTETLIGNEYSNLKKYLETQLKINKEDMETCISMIINSSSGYYDNDTISGTNTIIGKGMFIWPTPNYTTITSPFGYRTHPISGEYKLHAGVDVAAPVGSNFLAMADGKVIKATYSGGYGNMVMIEHGNNIVTLYAHGSKILVKTNQLVVKGSPVLAVGSTGNSTGPHAHFEVRINGEYINPMNYFEF